MKINLIVNALRNTFFLVVVGYALQIESARAQLISSESFNYSTGTVVGDNPGAAAGWASAWSTQAGSAIVTSPGLSFPTSTNLVSSGNALTVGNGAAIAKITYSTAFDSTMTTNGTYYASALIDMTAGATGSGAQGIFDLSSATANWAFGISSGGNFTLKTAAGVNTATSTAVASFNTTYYLVSKLVTTSQGNDTVYLNWYSSADAVPLTDPGTWMLSATVTGSTSTATNSYLTFQSGANGTYVIDQINLGTAWTGVVAVPEPSLVALLLMGVGVLGYTTRRRWMPCRP